MLSAAVGADCVPNCFLGYLRLAISAVSASARPGSSPPALAMLCRRKFAHCHWAVCAQGSPAQEQQRQLLNTEPRRVTAQQASRLVGDSGELQLLKLAQTCLAAGLTAASSGGAWQRVDLHGSAA